MDILALLEKINEIRREVIDLASGEGCSSPASVREAISELQVLVGGVDKREEFPDEIAPIFESLAKELVQAETEISTVDSENKLYINSENIILYEIERTPKGRAFQEKHGYVIFIDNKHLDGLKPLVSVKDTAGMEWKIEATDNEYVAMAENEIGDVVFGMKEIEELVTGMKTVEFK